MRCGHHLVRGAVGEAVVAAPAPNADGQRPGAAEAGEGEGEQGRRGRRVLRAQLQRVPDGCPGGRLGCVYDGLQEVPHTCDTGPSVLII